MQVKFWKTALSLWAGTFLGVGGTQADVHLNGGKIILQGGSLKLDASVAFSNYSASSYVVTSGTGTVQQTVGSSAVVFPIGTSTSYSPITLTNSGSSDIFALRVANLTSSVSDSNDMVNREWFLSEDTPGGSHLSATLQWNASDEGASFSRSGNLEYGLHNGASFSAAAITGISGSDPYTLRPSGLTSTFQSIVIGQNGAITGTLTTQPSPSGPTITITVTPTPTPEPEPDGPQILVSDEDSSTQGTGDGTNTTTLSSNNTQVKVPKGAQVIGDPGEQLTVILPVAANASKPATEVTSTIDIDGTLNIWVDTINPAETELTTGLLQLRPGTQTEVEEDGTISTQFSLGSGSLAATIDARGTLAAELTTRDEDGQEQVTAITAPEGTRSTVLDTTNQLDTLIYPEEFTRSEVEKARLTLNEDGTVLAQTPILDEDGNQRAQSTLHLPAGSKISGGYTAYLRSTFPSVSLSDGSQITPSLTQNFQGEVEVSLSTVDASGHRVTVLLPKMSAGSEVEWRTQGDGSKAIVSKMPLERKTESNARIGATLTGTQTGDYYMGRDPLTNAAIYLSASTDNTTLQIQRSLTDQTTTITVLTGEVEVNNGGTLGSLLANESLEVDNAVREFSLAEGITLFSFPINQDLSAADLEVRLPEAHSLWLWDVDNQSWQGYSPDLATAFRLVDNLTVAQLGKTTLSGQGVFIYSHDNLTLTLPDEPSGSLRDTRANTSSEWRLLGNNTDQPVTISELLATLPANVLALWRAVDSEWQVYSTDADILEQRDAENLAEWSINSMLAVGEAYWVQVQPTQQTTKVLRRPPPL